MHFTVAHISPIIALIAGILILIAPRLLRYIVAIYLIYLLNYIDNLIALWINDDHLTAHYKE
jgi:hypothetical protein